MAETVQGDDFVWHRSSSDAEAIGLLVRRFPFVLKLGESQQELTEMGAFYAYGIFAHEVAKRASDENLLRDTAVFVNDLVASKDSYLESVARIGILETIAYTSEVDEKLSQYLGVKALAMRKQLR